ncbi:unnamed protein product [Paramecium octaurelia]|uniref:Papain family cysteine protease n=1 Tax=Paramecium octaurelia TaxID=43137 RepID=A0A8S1UCU1_PAROT|nr:unnamed protein product [Paramecium octaurelia]
MIRTILTTAAISLLLLTNYYQTQSQPLTEFEIWQQKHQKMYIGEERIYREAVYQTNKQKIESHNKQQERTYDMGENQFMTLTQDEFISLYLTQVDAPELEFEEEREQVFDGAEPLKFVDWSSYSTIKSQGQCGSGWAFSVSNSIEAWYGIRGGRNISASTQQLIDCDTYSKGCYSGTNYNAMHYAQQIGLMNSMSYPYVAQQQGCRYNRGEFRINTYNFVGNQQQTLQNYLQYYPVSVGVDALNWQFYSNGTFADCGQNINHYVLAVGFDFGYNWLIQNSWGYGWGENGSIRLSPGNTCDCLNSPQNLNFL